MCQGLAQTHNIRVLKRTLRLHVHVFIFSPAVGFGFLEPGSRMSVCNFYSLVKFQRLVVDV